MLILVDFTFLKPNLLCSPSAKRAIMILFVVRNNVQMEINLRGAWSRLFGTQENR